MKIKEALPILRAEAIFERTTCGRSVTDYARNAIIASMNDTKNHEMECLFCLNCCIIISGLLCPEGCPNCGSKDMTAEINNEINNGDIK